ncbi:MAG: type I DNA topoisomerase, partial [Thermoanaerobacteraceae bacterium]|nr:type I DNA topoisomerase [Thermoanaerobacteraceae bacterium]
MVAQQLYEGLDIKGEGTVGLITYMRTDSTRVSEQAKQEAATYIKSNYGKDYLGNGTVKRGNKRNVQDAHEGIRPTSVFRTPEKVKDSLTKDQYMLYKLIWERFTSSQMAPAVYDTMSVSIKAGEYVFRVSGSTVKFPGFMLLYTEGSDEEEKEESQLPNLKAGQTLKLLELFPEQHFTQPPPRYTEAMLVKVLEEKGIGRPSTYAPTIDVIQKRGYVEKEKGRFKPTELGEIVVQIMQEFFSDIVDIDFTAEMEEQLDKIELGHQDRQELLKLFYTPFEKKLKVAEQELEKVKIEDEVSDEKCELCGRNMVIKRGRFGKFLACPGFPECKNTKPIVTEIGVNCPNCGGSIVVRRSKRGRIFYGCSNYPDCKFVSWNKPSGKSCPQCGGLMVVKKSKDKEYEVCSNKECGYKLK